VTSDPVKLTRDLVAIPSVSDSVGEGRVLELLADRLDARYEVRTTSDHRGLRAVAVVPREVTAPLLVFSGHADVVPVGDESTWTRHPFEPEIADGKLWGRGGSDMKAGLAAAVTALESAPAGAQVGALFTVEEETGSKGAALAGSLLDDITTGMLLVAEPTDGVAIRGHKGVTWVRVSAAGVAAHGSAPHLGSNAILTLAAVLERANALTDRPWETMNIGMVSGGTAPNIVPAHAEATIDMRTTVLGAGLVDWWQTQEDLAAVEVLLDLRPVMLGSGDPIVEQLGLEVSDRVASYFTDAAVLVDTLACDRVVLWGPGAMEQAHRLNEWVSVQSIIDTEAAFTDLIARWSTL